MSGTLRRGLIAGAVGTIVLDVVSYLDMVVRGRPASTMPGEVARAGLEQVGIDVSGGGDDEHRREALGALAGLGAGLGTGVALSTAHRLGIRFSALTGSVATAGIAMAASDGPAAALGVTDPRTWSRTDWLSDVVPHLAYGVATEATLRGLEKDEPALDEPHRPSLGLLVRSLALGLACGARSSMGLAAAAASVRGPARTPARLASVVAVGFELVADKNPDTPSRLEPEGMVPRFATGATGATGLAVRAGATADLPVVLAALGTGVGAVVGAAVREAAEENDVAWPAALAEDVVALALTWFAVS